MHRIASALTVTSVLMLIGGCAGVGVVKKSSPMAKLADADNLMEKQDRPLLAERLIQEVIQTCEQGRDQTCLAEAYRMYGHLLRAPISQKMSHHYITQGYVDRTITLNNRYEKALEYYQKADDIFAKSDRYDQLTNTQLNIGFSYELTGKNELACTAFQKSVQYNQQNISLNPQERVVLPRNFASYQQFIDGHLQRLNCPQ